MAKAKKCQVGHKGCDCTLICCSVPPDRVEEIRAGIEATRGRSMFAGSAPAVQCRCGVPRKPPGISKYVNDDGKCLVHPDREPERYTRGAERYESFRPDIRQPGAPGGSLWILLWAWPGGPAGHQDRPGDR